jgi:hypothetical protein
LFPVPSPSTRSLRAIDAAPLSWSIPHTIKECDGVTIQPAGCSIAVGFATKGRASVLVETIAELSRQTQAPTRIIVSYTEPSDIAGLVPAPGIELICTTAGLCHQRNAILDRLVDDASDVVLFFDDDFLPMPDYLFHTAQAFHDHPDIAVTTGEVLADGIKGPGLTIAYGREVLARQPAQVAAQAFPPALNGYGCNMAIRLSIVRHHGMRFDEDLPLYGWLEDVDFTCRVGAYGRIVKVTTARGVHLGVKSGRGSGRRLGYSQVINPVAIAKKGLIPWRRAVVSLGKNIIANSVRIFAPEPYIDRRGRLWGNLLGLKDLALGKVKPTKVLDL